MHIIYRVSTAHSRRSRNAILETWTRSSVNIYPFFRQCFACIYDQHHFPHSLEGKFKYNNSPAVFFSCLGSFLVGVCQGKLENIKLRNTHLASRGLATILHVILFTRTYRLFGSSFSRFEAWTLSISPRHHSPVSCIN